MSPANTDHGIGYLLRRTGLHHRTAQRRHERQQEDRLQVERGKRLLLGQHAKQHNGDRADASRNVHWWKALEIVGGDHRRDRPQQDNHRKPAFPSLRRVRRGFTARFGRARRLFRRHQLRAGQRVEDCRGEEQRDADAGVFEELDAHRAF